MPAPMITGPTMRDPVICTPSSRTTRPMSSVAASAVPRRRGSRLSSTMRFTSSMSATLPVSFQYPEMTDDVTLAPWSISHWIASVISSSFRHDGLSCRTASWTWGENI